VTVTGGRKPQIKGKRYENEVIKWLCEHGWPLVERRIPGMEADRGDITGWPGVVIDCKNRKTLCLSEWMAKLDLEAAEVSASTAALIVKRRGHLDVGQHYAVMSVEAWAQLMHAAGY
jgi:hypothetical protein